MRVEAARKQRYCWLKSVLSWIPLVFIAILNGVIREVGYARYYTELTSHQISTVSLILLFGIYVWFISRKWKLKSAHQAAAVGIGWLLLTVTFEFLFGHYFMGHSWSSLFQDYNVAEGRLWAFVLIWLAFAPYVMNRI